MPAADGVSVRAVGEAAPATKQARRQAAEAGGCVRAFAVARAYVYSPISLSEMASAAAAARRMIWAA